MVKWKVNDNKDNREFKFYNFCFSGDNYCNIIIVGCSTKFNPFTPKVTCNVLILVIIIELF